MKARIVTEIPERALLFSIKETVRPQLEAVLEELAVEARTVERHELGQDVGYLAGFHGFEKKPDFTGTPPESEGVLCMCGMSGRRMDRLLKALQERQIEVPIKAAVTAANQRWSFAALAEELNREHRAVLKQKQARRSK